MTKKESKIKAEKENARFKRDNDNNPWARDILHSFLIKLNDLKDGKDRTISY